MVQTGRMNPYFDISSKTQICQKCHLRPYCVQPAIRSPFKNKVRIWQMLVPNVPGRYSTEEVVFNLNR